MTVIDYTLYRDNGALPFDFDEISSYMNILTEVYNRFVGEGQYECYSFFDGNNYCTTVEYPDDILTDDEAMLLEQEFLVRLEDILGPMEGA